MISHHHKTVFVHIPKCGGQSIETLFLDDLELDWDTRAPLLLRPNDTPRLGPPRLAHLLASEYLRFKYISDEQYKTYYKFAVVRDPYARVVSLYNYLIPQGDFDSFLFGWLSKQFELKDSYRSYPHEYKGLYHFVRPQAEFIHTETGALLVDEVFRLEDISKWIGELTKKCGLSSTLKHVNKSENRIGMKDLNDQHFKKITELYADDFRIFHYPVKD